MAERSAAPVVTWGLTTGDVRGADLDLDEQARVSFALEIPEGLTTLTGDAVSPGSFPVRPDLLGEHQAANVLAALTAALVAGVDPAAAAAALDGATLASAQRMQALRAGGVLIIDDAYNANPDSMKQALKTLAHLGRSHRTIAVLGEMLELGGDSVRLHDEIGLLRGAVEHRPALRGRCRRRPHPPRSEPRGQLRWGVRAPRHRRGGDRRAGTDRATRRRGTAEVLPRRRAAPHRQPLVEHLGRRGGHEGEQTGADQ